MTSAIRSRGLFLAVDIRLRPDADVDGFLQKMKAVLPMFTGDPQPDDNEPFGWTLIASAQRKPREQGAGRDFFNLWKLPKPLQPTIWEAMAAAGANNDYIRLDGAVEHEVQELVHSNDVYSPTALHPQKRGMLYVRETLSVSGDPVKIAGFEQQMPVVAEEAREQYQAKLLLALENVTGRLRTFTQLWCLQEDNSKALVDFLKKQAIYRTAVRHSVASVMEAIDYETVTSRSGKRKDDQARHTSRIVHP
jgi:hypothetical protein